MDKVDTIKSEAEQNPRHRGTKVLLVLQVLQLCAILPFATVLADRLKYAIPVLFASGLRESMIITNAHGQVVKPSPIFAWVSIALILAVAGFALARKTIGAAATVLTHLAIICLALPFAGGLDPIATVFAAIAFFEAFRLRRAPAPPRPATVLGFTTSISWIVIIDLLTLVVIVGGS